METGGPLFDEVGSFSKGMRQKLAIARSLIHEPKILFLDEPTSGLDPEASRLVRDFIEELKAEGTTIFLCTHNLDEADHLCQRIAIFKSHLITVDTPQNLRNRLFGKKVVFHFSNLQTDWIPALSSMPGVHAVEPVDNRLIISLDNPEEQNPAIIRKLVDMNADIQFVGELRHSLEDIYLEMIRS